MKSSNGGSAVSALLCIMFAIVLILAAAAVWNVFPQAAVVGVVNYLTGSSVPVRVVIGAAMLALAVFCCVAAFGRGASRPEKDRSELNLLEKSEAGSAFVSSTAIDSLVQRCVGKNDKVRACQSRIRPFEGGGIVAELRLVVVPDCNMAVLCAELRRDIKNYIESVTGIAVRDVSCAVIGIDASTVDAESEKRVK